MLYVYVLKRSLHYSNAPDTGFGERADTRNRSVRIKNLPPNTESQEGLLQQALEKIAKVKRVEIIGDTCEALVEMINAAVRSSITFSDCMLTETI